MLKLPRHRQGKDARTFWAFAGCVWPEDLLGLTLEFERDGAFLVAENGFQLKKGTNLIELPAPKLSHLAIFVTPSVQLSASAAVSGVSGGGLYSDLALRNGLWLKVNCKDDAVISTVAHIYLIGD